MDINEYMAKSLGLLERIAEGIESLNEQGVHVTNFTLPEGTDLKVVGQVAHAQPADKVEKKAEAKAEEKKPEAKVEEKKEAEVEEAKVEKKKRATADDARKALKAYAAIEGNAAAMELLTSVGGNSVSSLEEASTDEDDKLAELIAKCGG